LLPRARGPFLTNVSQAVFFPGLFPCGPPWELIFPITGVCFASFRCFGPLFPLHQWGILTHGGRPPNPAAQGSRGQWGLRCSDLGFLSFFFPSSSGFVFCLFAEILKASPLGVRHRFPVSCVLPFVSSSDQLRDVPFSLSWIRWPNQCCIGKPL